MKLMPARRRGGSIAAALLALLLLSAGTVPVTRAWLAQQLRSRIELTAGEPAAIQVWAQSGETSTLLIDGGLPTGRPAARLSAEAPEMALLLRVRNPSGETPARFRLAFGLTEDGEAAVCRAVQPTVQVYAAGDDTALLLGDADVFPAGVNTDAGECLPPGDSRQYALTLQAFPEELTALGREGETLSVWLRAECVPERTHFAGDADTLRALLEGGLADGDTVALTGDVTLPEDVTAYSLFHLRLNGCTLDLAGHTLTVETGDRFGVMDFSSGEGQRNAFGRTGRILGGLAFEAEGAALRIPADFLGANPAGLHLRLFNGLPPRGPEGELPLVLTASALPGTVSYRDVPLSRDFAGQGTAGDPYRIQSVGDYKRLEATLNSGAAPDGYAGCHFLLCADLDFTGRGPVPPIGGGETAFRGCFDGGGHRLVGLEIRGEAAAGVFGVVEDGCVQFLVKEGGAVCSDGGEAGGIVGIVRSGGMVRACIQTGTVEGASCAGGIAGVCGPGAALYSCYAVGTEEVAGRTADGALLANCFCLEAGESGPLSMEDLAARLNRTAPLAFPDAWGGEGLPPLWDGGPPAPIEPPAPALPEADRIYRVSADTLPSPASVTASP